MVVMPKKESDSVLSPLSHTELIPVGPLKPHGHTHSKYTRPSPHRNLDYVTYSKEISVFTKSPRVPVTQRT